MVRRIFRPVDRRSTRRRRGAYGGVAAAAGLVATAIVVAGSASMARAYVPHSGRGFDAAGVAARSAAVVQHEGRASALTGAADRASAVVRHGGRALVAAGSADMARGSAAHRGRAAVQAGSSDKAAGTVQHRGRSGTAAGAGPRAPASTAHKGRASSPAEEVAQAKPIKPGLTSARGQTAAGAVDKAQARAAHGGSAKVQAGDAAKASGKSQRAGRAQVSGGTSPSAPGRAAHAGRSRAEAGELGPGKPQARHGGTAADPQVGSLEQAKPVSRHGGRGHAATDATVMGAGRSAHVGRAQAEAGQGANYFFAPAEVLGFYQRTSKAVRARFRTVAGALPVQYSNLPFVQPSGVAWARCRVDFDKIEEVQYGAGRATYRAPGVLRAQLRVPILQGVKPALDLADALAAALERQEVSGVIYRNAHPRRASDLGDDYLIDLVLPFVAEDSAFAKPATGAVADDDFEGAEAQVRARFRALLPDLVVSYDNLPPSIGANWIRLMLDEPDGFNVDNTVRRTVGVMTAEVHTPLLQGEKSSLQIADRIVEAFRLVDAGGVKFSVPYLRAGGQVRDDWVLPVYCPWTCDHA